MTDEQIVLVGDALGALSGRQPQMVAHCDQALSKLLTGDELGETDRSILALALQGKCMYDGPGVWIPVNDVVNGLGIGDLFRSYLESWIKYGSARGDE